MRLKILVTVISALAIIPLYSQEKSAPVYRGFSGGMLLHGGYLGGADPNLPYNPGGAPFGIGGSLRIRLFDHLRVGGEGYVSTLDAGGNLLKSGSQVSLGAGGILVDYIQECGKVWLYAGTTFGGGSKKSLFIEEGSQDDWKLEERTYFNKTSYFFAAPYLGMDYCLTSKVHLTTKLDYTWQVHNEASIHPSGIRLYLGFMFCH